MRVLTFHLSIREHVLVTWPHLETARSDGFRMWGLWTGEGHLGPASRARGREPPHLHTLHTPYASAGFRGKLLLKIANNGLGGLGGLSDTLIRCALEQDPQPTCCDVNNQPLGQHLYVLCPYQTKPAWHPAHPIGLFRTHTQWGSSQPHGLIEALRPVVTATSSDWAGKGAKIEGWGVGLSASAQPWANEKQKCLVLQWEVTWGCLGGKGTNRGQHWGHSFDPTSLCWRPCANTSKKKKKHERYSNIKCSKHWPSSCLCHQNWNNAGSTQWFKQMWFFYILCARY